MCKKLIYICFILVMAVPVLAAEPIMMVDIDGEHAGTKDGWTGWGLDRGLTEACHTKIIGDCMVELCGIEHEGRMPGSRLREDLCDWQSGDMLQDLFFVGSTGNVLMGREYIKLTVTGCLEPYTCYGVGVWSYDQAYDSAYSHGWGLKWSAWGTENPSDYLDGLGYGPDEGYQPTDYDDPCTTEDESGIYKNPIPTLARVFMEKNPATGHPYSHFSNWGHFNAETDEYGNLVVYGWYDGDTMSGSQHVPINGFVIIPEPATIALLGLGGLALLRRRRR